MPRSSFRSGAAALGRLSLVVLALSLAAGCGGGGGQASKSPATEVKPVAPAPAPATAAAPPAAAPAVTPEAEAETIFAQRCSTCHGTDGKGNGPASAGLDPKPRDFTLPEWQDSVTDEHVDKIILEGGLAVGRSALMPPNPDLIAKPDVVKALRAHVRGLRAH